MRRRDHHGFSLIEVSMVLAIFGLIIAIVFLAVPQAQKVRRDNKRKHDLGLVGDNLAKLRDSFDNAHEYPQTGNTLAGCLPQTGVFECLFDPASSGVALAGKYHIDNGVDPASNTSYLYKASAGPTLPPLVAPSTSQPAEILYINGWACGVTTGAANPGIYQINISLESGTTFCLDNH